MEYTRVLGIRGYGLYMSADFMTQYLLYFIGLIINLNIMETAIVKEWLCERERGWTSNFNKVIWISSLQFFERREI